MPSILQAVRVDSLQGVRAALEEDPFVVCRSVDSRREPILITALRRACSPRLIAILMQAGADPNSCGPDGMTALDFLVAMQGPCRALEASSRAPWMQHVLQAAPWDGQPRAPREVALLTAREIAARSDQDSTGTGLTSAERRCAYANALLAFGADASRKGKDGLSAAERAEQAGHAAFAQYLLHWAGIQLDALRRTSRCLARRTPSLRAAIAAPRLRALSPQAGHPAMLSEAGQGSLQSLPDELLVRICTMLAKISA